MRIRRAAARATGRPLRLLVVTCACTFALASIGLAGAATKSHHKSNGKKSPMTTQPKKKLKGPPLRHAENLQYFQKSTQVTLQSASGKTLKASAHAGKGDVLKVTSEDYVGSHTKHAKKATATGTLSCTYKSATAAICTNKIDINGSSILSSKVPVTMGGPVMSIAVTDGSGTYEGAHGLVTATQVGQSHNADLVIVVLPKAA